MKKLIKIEVDEFEDGNICYGCSMEGCEGYPHDDNRCYVKRWIDEQPTVDAVPVVRCKDCYRYHSSDGLIKEGYCCMSKGADWHCADGRKDGE